MEYIMEDITTRCNMPEPSTTLPENISDPLIENYLEKNISRYDEETYDMVIEYISGLDWYDIMALKISIQMLKSSFDLIKSNGFIEWKNEKIKLKKNL